MTLYNLETLFRALRLLHSPSEKHLFKSQKEKDLSQIFRLINNSRDLKRTSNINRQINLP